MLMVISALSIFALFGCNSHSNAKGHHADESELKPMQQSYQGVLPCADCQGINTALFLDKNGTWVMTQDYIGKKTTFATFGSWARTASQLVLTEPNGEKTYFRAGDDSLLLLDSEGNTINSLLNYRLNAENISLPTTPMPMVGEYKYFADAAVFQECGTQKTYPVEGNIVLEKGYLKSRSDKLEPVLLKFNAHFTEQEKPDSDQRQLTIVSDGDVHFYPNKNCQKQ